MRRARPIAAAIALLWTSEALGQGRPPRMPQPTPGRPPIQPSAAQQESGDLRGRFGVSVAERLLASSDAASRLRAIRRLAAIGTAQAVDALVRSQEPGAATARDVRARLEAVRGLAPHLDQDGPRQVVLRALVEGGADADGELGLLLRETAALVLAKEGGPRGTEALVGLVRQGGVSGAAALRALLAYPPESIEPLAGPRAPASAAAADLLAQLGDLRAMPFLRRAVRQGDAATRTRALEAMAELGDGEAGLIARSWARVDDATARLAAARALVRAAPAEGRALCAALLSDPASRDEALELAALAPGPELAAALLPLTQGNATASIRKRAIVALGRAGGEAAAEGLASLLGQPGSAHEAGLALALSPGEAARKAIERAMGDPARRVPAVRAATVRALALRDEPSGLEAAAAEAFRQGGAGRAAAAFAWVALGRKKPHDPELLREADLVPALARASLVLPSGDTSGLLEALAASGDDRARSEALGVALVARPDGGPLPTSRLLAWVEAGGSLAPLAARALAARDEEATRGLLASLASSGDPQLRAHVALGLGRSPKADAAGRLAEAYPFEADPSVRRAIVRALSRRTEPIRRAVLELASSFDPDPAARAAARAALKGKAVSELSRGEMVGWAQVASSSPELAGQAGSFRWERPEGLVLPVVPDLDGALLVPGLTTGVSHVSLAAPTP